MNNRIPFLPTETEGLLLALYPLTLFLGSAFSHFSPLTRPPWTTSTYSPTHQSFYPPEGAPSYFAQKRNVFNVYFVKFGWFWCSLALLVFVGLVSRGRAAGAAARKRFDAMTVPEQEVEAGERWRRMWQVALRYAVATTFWLAVTQWFFGPPLVDRGFALTGGACILGVEKVVEGKEAEFVKVLTHAACNMAGGRWRGGIDISGHVFLLVLGSAMLWLEMLPVLSHVDGLTADRVVKEGDGKVRRVGSPSNQVFGQEQGKEALLQRRDTFDMDPQKRLIKSYATTLAFTVAGLSWWMLLMTAAFFHTWFEKVTGCILALVGVFVVYFLPRGVPALRDVLGMPGV